MTNDKWYRIAEGGGYELTEDAPEEAVKSFNEYQKNYKAIYPDE